MMGMYIHIPFCKEKCKYCDFNSFTSNEVMRERYVEALLKEIATYKKADFPTIDTVFIGGGTPSVLSAEQLTSIVEAVKATFDIDEENEFSIEMNPDTVEFETVQKLLSAGVNRFSMGLQSTDDKMLQTLGRVHSKDMFLNAYNDMRKAGAKNINVDLMFALPNQTLETWKETLEEVIQLEPEHISAYSLKIEEGTIFDKLYEDDKLNLPDEDVDREMYRLAKSLLSEAGYIQYEISNFAKSGKLSRHNLNYWINGEYIGLGLGSHGNINGTRYSNETNIEKYINLCKNNVRPVVEENKISIEEQMFESVILGLRLNEGLDMKAFEKRYGVSPIEKYGDILESLKTDLLIEVSDDRIKLTDYGVDISNQVFIKFMEEE